MTITPSAQETITHHLAEGQVSVVTLPPRLIMANAPAVRSQIETLIQTGKTHLVLDLSQVEMLDSSGLSVLISALKRARSFGGDVHLTGLNDDVRSLLELTRMHLLFCIYEERDAAVAALA